jgi:hypothetical protein
MRARTTDWTRPGRWATSNVSFLVECNTIAATATFGSNGALFHQHPIQATLVVSASDVHQIIGIHYGTVHPVDDRAIDDRAIDESPL